MRIVVVDNGSRHLKALEHLCGVYGEMVVVDADRLGEIRDDDMVVLSGSHAHWVKGSGHFYGKERELVRDHQGPLIGICAGMELIASIYGAQLGKMGGDLMDSRPIRLLDPELRFALGGGPIIRVAERHSWAVGGIHAPLKVLAYSDSGAEVVAHMGKPIWGLQFHPELKPEGGRRIFDWIMARQTKALSPR